MPIPNYGPITTNDLRAARYLLTECEVSITDNTDAIRDADGYYRAWLVIQDDRRGLDHSFELSEEDVVTELQIRRWFWDDGKKETK